MTTANCLACHDIGKVWEDNDVGAVEVPCHRCCCADCGRETKDPYDGLCEECGRMARGAEDVGREVRP